ncbi:MAG: hypothetical protein EOR86_04145 [Mesorhizobium sp.]|uniref:hypothetical protein n=1 Tax=Mesorhizobium sp. TaxID=1871066 RepID=UPI000FE696D5|nr:hypothetical protein [Mesorhizobium sp.]RWN01051.1 MAG: hypothetical protein EOR86_04145 [Mesorhizobium sp.]
MKLGSVMSEDIERIVRDTARDLVRLERINGAFFLNLPLLYPDGSFVTVRIDQMPNAVRISDAGFAYREAEDVDAARSFKRTANKVAEVTGISVGERTLSLEVPVEDIHRAILDVAESSWRVADHICQRVFDEDEDELSEALNERLIGLFGAPNVSHAPITGASNNEWRVSATVAYQGHKVIFQAVGEHANSVYKASTAFHDIAGLPHAPRLVAVVKSKKAMGSKLSLLAPARVVEEAQPDDLFKKAAA